MLPRRETCDLLRATPQKCKPSVVQLRPDVFAGVVDALHAAYRW